jgi:hypothetical protein
MKWVFLATVVLNVALGVFLYLHNTRPNPDARLPALQMNAEQIRIVDPRELPARPQASACLEWRSFGVAELKRAQDLLEPLALGERVQTREVSVTTNWWVYMPPQGSQRLMERKAAELRSLGITDYFPITQPGQWRYAITLGSFATEQGARAFFERLQGQGVRTAEVGQRELRVTHTALLIRDPTAQQSVQLVELANNFPGTELRATECPS